VRHAFYVIAYLNDIQWANGVNAKLIRMVGGDQGQQNPVGIFIPLSLLSVADREDILIQKLASSSVKPTRIVLREFLECCGGARALSTS